jgi:DNA-directed RNA polymerase specialized sigma24 family protein
VLPALPHPFTDDEQERPRRSRACSHLDTVYGFALTLTGDPGIAAELTEDVYASARDGLWATLGGHGLRDRLLARCVSMFAETISSLGTEAPVAPTRHEQRSAELSALLRTLPWMERAAIALVDQLDLTYAAGASVLGVDVAEFRALLHWGRAALFGAYRAGARGADHVPPIVPSPVPPTTRRVS